MFEVPARGPLPHFIPCSSILKATAVTGLLGDARICQRKYPEIAGFALLYVSVENHDAAWRDRPVFTIQDIQQNVRYWIACVLCRLDGPNRTLNKIKLQESDGFFLVFTSLNSLHRRFPDVEFLQARLVELGSPDTPAFEGRNLRPGVPDATGF